jgi:hypothetical protein
LTIAQTAGEFESLVKAANSRVQDLQLNAHFDEVWSNAAGWIALFVTCAITILAAFAGVNVNQLPTSPEARSKLVISIAVLGAVGSSLLLVNERLDGAAATARKTAKQLYEQTLNRKVRDEPSNQARRRQCKVISGGQLRRTGRTLDPAPTEV